MRSARDRKVLAWLAAATFAAIVLANTVPAFPLVVAAALAFAGFLTLAAAAVRLRISRTGFLVLAFLGWNLVTGLTSGGLRPLDLVDLDFWRNDGRLFVAYAPLVLLSFHEPTLDSLQKALRFITAVALLSFGHFVVFQLIGGRGPRFEGFFTHHIGAGGFFGLFAVAFLVIGAEMRSGAYRWLGFGLFFLMLAAGSRAALLAGAATVGVWMVANREGRRAAGTLMPALLVLALLVPWFAPNAFGRFTEFRLSELPAEMVRGAEDISWQDPGQERTYGGPYWNAVWRVVFWRRGWDLFTESPLVGVGFGRYNDSNFTTVGLEGVAAQARGGYVLSSPLSAHNTVLHLLAETGLVGLALFLAVWTRILRRTRVQPRDPPLLVGVRQATRYCVLYVAVTSIFGHVFAAPSLMLFLGGLSGLATEVDPSRDVGRGGYTTARTSGPDAAGARSASPASELAEAGP